MVTLSEEAKRPIGEIYPALVATARKAGKPSVYSLPLPRRKEEQQSVIVGFSLGTAGRPGDVNRMAQVSLPPVREPTFVEMTDVHRV